MFDVEQKTNEEVENYLLLQICKLMYDKNNSCAVVNYHVCKI